MGNKNTKFFDDLSKGATWSAGVAFKRSNPLPLDRYSVFETKALAEAYATSNAVAYPGQVIAVAEGNKMVAYVLAENAAGDALVLQQIGIIPTGDDKTIDVTEDGVISLLAADAEVFKKDAEGNPTEEKEINAGAQLVLQADGTLKWVKPDTTTVEGLSTAVEDLKGRMTTAEGDIDALEEAVVTEVERATGAEEDLAEAIEAEAKARADADAELSARIGYASKEATDDDEAVEASGVYVAIEAEVARAKAAEKALDDAIKAIDFVDETELATELAPYAKTADVNETLEDYATIEYVDGEIEAIEDAISKLNHFTTKIVNSEDEVTEEGVLYLIKDTSVTGVDKYNEYLYVGGEAVLIGDTTTDLSDYYTKGQVDTALDAKADKVTGATAGNFAGLDANGNLTDSGKKAADFEVAGAAAAVLGTDEDDWDDITVKGNRFILDYITDTVLPRIDGMAESALNAIGQDSKGDYYDVQQGDADTLTAAKAYADGLAGNYDEAGAAEAVKTELIGTADDNPETADTIKAAKALANYALGQVNDHRTSVREELGSNETGTESGIYKLIKDGDAANTAAIQTLTNTHNTDKAALEAAIALKADKATYEAKVAELEGKITTAQNQANKGVSDAATAQAAAEAAQGTANTNAANIEELDKFLFGREAVEGQEAIVGLNSKVANNTTRIGTLEGTVAGHTTAIGNNTTAAANAQAQADEALRVANLKTTMAEVEAKGYAVAETVNAEIAKKTTMAEVEAKGYAVAETVNADLAKKADKETTYTKTEVDGLIAPLATTEALNGVKATAEQGVADAAAAKSVADAAKARIDGFLDGTAEAESAIDTLVEIQQYMNSDTEAFTALSEKVTKIENGATAVPKAVEADTLDGKHAADFDAAGAAAGALTEAKAYADAINTGVMGVTSLHDAIVVTTSADGKVVNINFANEIILNGGGANVAAE